MVQVKSKLLMMLKDPVEVVHSSLTTKLGCPVDIVEVKANQSNFELEKVFSFAQQLSVQKIIKPEVPEEKPIVKIVKASSSDCYMPIKALNTFMKDWTIRARVNNKGELKTTMKGGKLLKIEIIDHFGTPIEGTFFNDAAIKFSEIVNENKVYLFSGGNVKMANKRFTTVKNDFCIIFETNAEIVEIEDDGSITKQEVSYLSIGDIETA